MIMHTAKLVAAAVLICALLAACGGATRPDGSSSQPSTATTAPPSSTSPTPAKSMASIDSLSMKEVGERFIAAMKRGDTAEAATYVQATTPAIAAAAVAQTSESRVAWQRVTGAGCRGLVCFASGYPATPEPGWLMQESEDGWHVAAGVSCASPNGSCVIKGSRPPQTISRIEAGF